MKFHGLIGFWFETDETKPGIYRPRIEEKEYFGDITQNYRDWQSAEKQNDNLSISNRISIISDLYLQENLASVRYVVWMGVKWKVTKVDLTTYPYVTLQLGDVYNGKEQVTVTQETM